MSVLGFSMNSLNELSHLIAASSSQTRASLDIMNVVTWRMLWSSITFGRLPPTARMHACGGLMTALKDLIPIIPKFEIVNDPPWYSCGISVPFRARPASSLMVLEMLKTDLPSASGIIGVMRPDSVATAIEMSTDVNGTISSLRKCELTIGTVRRASAEALTITSFTENLSPCSSNICVRSASSSVTSTSIWVYECGIVVLLSVSRWAITRRIVVTGMSMNCGSCTSFALWAPAVPVTAAAAPPAVGNGDDGCTVGGGASPMKARTSPLRMCPFGPDAGIAAGSRAYRLTNASTAGDSGFTEPEAAARVAAGVTAAEDSRVSAAGAAAGSAASARDMSGFSSDASTSKPTTVLIGTPFEPPSMSTVARNPSSVDSTAIVALSVSISNKRSPVDTSSPTDLCHCNKAPSVIVGERAGIVIGYVSCDRAVAWIHLTREASTGRAARAATPHPLANARISHDDQPKSDFESGRGGNTGGSTDRSSVRHQHHRLPCQPPAVRCNPIQHEHR
eukprot:m.317645 g.317645  ORF g.317645 m.317645 type:complete len:507 (-) comp27559_c0_seq1:811-2331(-)